MANFSSAKSAVIFAPAFCCSVTQSCLTLRDPMDCQHARSLCHSPSPDVCPNSCPLHQWCHPTISSSVTLFSFCLEAFPALGSFPVSWLLTSGGQSIGVSFVLPINIQGWFPLGLPGLISLVSKGLSRVFSSTTVWKHQFFGAQLSHRYMTTGKTTALTIWTFAGKLIFFLFNKLSRFIITFLPRNSCLLISWLQSPSAVILDPTQKKSLLPFFPLHLPWSDGAECHDLSFFNFEF